MVSVILNQASSSHLYPLEGQLRILSKGACAYVIGLFDCCRERISTRGGPGVPTAADYDENLILAFGCAPSRFTAAASTLAQDFFNFLVNAADENGYVALPGNLNFFQTKDRKNETLIKVSKPALLRLTLQVVDGQPANQTREQLINFVHELDDY